jgi:hypothetical protein
MSGFTIGPLSPDQIHTVYPLIREAVPSLDLAGWVRFARQLIGPRWRPRRDAQGGIIAIRRDGRDFPCGLFCYRVEEDLKLGRVLTADHFVAVDLLDPAAVLAALVAELDALAQRLDCRAVRGVVHGGSPDLAGGLAAAGHRPEASLLLKRLLEASPGTEPGKGVGDGRMLAG